MAINNYLEGLFFLKMIFYSSADRDLFIDYIFQNFAGCCDFCDFLKLDVESCNGFCCDMLKNELIRRSIVIFPFL